MILLVANASPAHAKDVLIDKFAIFSTNGELLQERLQHTTERLR